jgi:hypothetical protein
VYENKYGECFGSKRCRESQETEEYHEMRIFIIYTLYQILLELGGACSTYGRDEKCIHYFGLYARTGHLGVGKWFLDSSGLT